MDSNNITFPIYNADGTPFHDLVLHKSVVDSVVMSLGDKITGDVYYKDNTLPVTMSEYIEYKRNEDSDVVRYVLVNPPTIIREGMASDNSELRGMTKYSFTFYHPMYQLGNIPFTDVAVSSNEEKYLSQSKTFSWAGRGLDFINKINKNLQGTPWLVIASTDAYTVEKLSLQPDKVVHSKSENNVESNVLSFDKVFISDAIKKAYDTWEVPFVVDSIQHGEYYYTNGQNQRIDYYDEGKRFVVLFGVPSNEIYNKTSHVAQGKLSYNGRYYYMNKAITLHTGEGIEITNFTPSYILKANVASEQEVVTPSLVGELLSDTGKYIATEDMFVVIGSNNTSPVKPYKYLTPFVFMFGQGVGLKNNSRTPKNNKIVTRIIGSGSENNIPYGYPQIPWYGDQTWKYTINNQSGTHEITLPDGRNVWATSYPIYKGILGGRYVNLIKHPFTRNQLMPSVYRETLFNKVSPYKFRAVRQDETNYVSLQTIYDYINQMIGSAESGSVLHNAYQELKDTIESVVASEELKTVTFGNAQSDGYEGSVTSYSSTFYTLVRGTLEVDGVEYVNYSFEDASVKDIALDSYKNEDFDPTIELVDYYDADDDTYQHPAVQGSESSEIHQFGDIKPEFTQHSIVDIQPYNLEHADDIPFYDKTINSLMPFLNQCYTDAKNEKAKACLREVIDLIPYTHGNDDDFYVTETDGSYTCECKVKAVDKYYLVVTFTSPDLNFVKHALQNGVTNPPVDWDDSLKPDSDEYVQSYFKMKLPQLDFDLYACASITEEMKINMRSGACIGCTFDVYVDWDDYKANFYKEEGGKSVFDPIIHTTEGDGHVRDGNKYPDSSQGQVTLIVKKDLDTFGTLMPNTYQQPEQGDEFVILGISLPETYITNAEGRLDDAMEEYMLENNVYYYEYPLKFDEHFLATHKDILAQIRNNTIIRFQYGGESMALYVKQMTIKYGDSPLPKYDITLSDDVEIVLNQIGQTMDDVSRMRVQVSELQKYYSQNIINAINEKLSKVVDDVCQGRITFQQGLDAIGSAIFRNELRSPDFVSGLYAGKGWRIDELGNAEMESLRVRSYLEIVELLVNRMQAQEGDTMFSDNDQIDKVDKIEVGGNVSYILSLKEKWSGYITSQMYGNILKGIINTLAAQHSGISDVTTDSVYYTSWMRVVDTHNTDGTLGVNQIRVELYNDNETPARKNFEPCELMTIARWGCMGYNAYYSEKYQAEGLATETDARESIKRRQQVFYLSTSEGRIVKLNSVYKPKLENGNYGTTLGELPEFVKKYSAVAPRLVDGGDYLYAQGIVVGDFIKIDKKGMPMVNYVDKGEWKDNTEYLVNEYNSDTMQYETHDVWHNGAYWRCLIHQPLGGTYYEPSDGSQYWKKLLKSGNDLNIKGNAITIEVGDIVDVWGAYEEPSILSKTEKDDAILGSATHEVSGDHYVLRRTDEYWDEKQEKLLHYVVENVELSDVYVIKEKQGVPTDYNEHMFVATARNDDASDGIYYWQDLGRLRGEKGDQGENAVLYTLEPSIPQFNTNVERTKVQTCVVSAYKTYGSTKEAYTGYFRVVANFESTPSLAYLHYGNSVKITTNKASNAISYTVILYDTALITHETKPLAMINIPVAFDGEKGDDGESYYITTPFDSIMIAPNERTAQLAGTFSLFKKIGEGQPASYEAYYSIYKRSGSTYTLISSTIAKSNSCIISETVDMSCEAVAVFAFDNQYSGTSPHTQAYIAKAEVMVIKESDLTQPNILKRTVFDYGVENIKDGWITDWRCVSIPTNTPDTDVQGRLSVRINASLLTSPQAGDFVDFAQNVYGRLKPSTWYTLSFYSFATHQFNTYLWSGTGSYVIDYNAGWYIDGVFSSGSSSIPSDGHVYWHAGWTGKRHTITFKTVSSFPTQNFYIMFRTYYISTEQGRAQTAICMPKLELGQVATEYVPNEDDQRGKTGRFFYYSGFDWNPNDNTHTFVVNNVQVPYFSKAGSQNNQYYLFNPDVMPSGGAMTMAQMAAATTSGGSIDWNSKPWEVMTNDFKYLITEAIFAQFAQFGSAIINGDWMLSTNGTINGVAYNNGALYNGSPAYTWFDPQYPNESVNTAHSVNGKEWTGYNFVPNYAVDLLTGATYQHNAYIQGEVHATRGTFENGSFNNVNVSGNIYTPYFVIDNNNVNNCTTLVDGKRIIRLEVTGLNIMFNFDGDYSVYLQLPKDSALEGAETNLYTNSGNVTISGITINNNLFSAEQDLKIWSGAKIKAKLIKFTTTSLRWILDASYNQVTSPFSLQAVDCGMYRVWYEGSVLHKELSDSEHFQMDTGGADREGFYIVQKKPTSFLGNIQDYYVVVCGLGSCWDGGTFQQIAPCAAQLTSIEQNDFRVTTGYAQFLRHGSFVFQVISKIRTLSVV